MLPVEVVITMCERTVCVLLGIVNLSFIPLKLTCLHVDNVLFRMLQKGLLYRCGRIMR